MLKVTVFHRPMASAVCDTPMFRPLPPSLKPRASQRLVTESNRTRGSPSVALPPMDVQKAESVTRFDSVPFALS